MPVIKTATQKASLFSALGTLADEISGIGKQASAAPRIKTAGPVPADPGGYQGPSSHPSTGIDNDVQNAEEGFRSSENTTDIKEDQGAPSVDSTPEATEGGGDADADQLQIGTDKSSTGNDPSVEDDYKDTKDDPGTSHPAKADNGGEKYASVSLRDGIAKSAALGDSILADLANGFGNKLTAGIKKAATAAAAPAKPAAAPAAPTSPLAKAAATVAAAKGKPEELAGYELAEVLGVTKAAAFASVQASVEQTIRDAQIDADLFGSYFTTRMKMAAGEISDEASSGEDHSAAGDAGSGKSDAGAPPADMGGGPGPDLAALAGGGGAPPGGDPMAGGPPPGAGGDPAGGGAGGPSPDAALQELAMALQELGIPLDQLAAAGAAGGGAGGPPPGAGGPPPGAGGPPGAPPMDPTALAGGAPPMGDPAGGAPSGMKLASAVRGFMRSGKFQIKAAAPGTPERKLRDEMKTYVLELVGA